MLKQFAKIVDHTNLVRDMDSQAILNTDLTVVRRHEKRMAELVREETRTREIESLKNELNDIRGLLKTLLPKN